MGFFEILLRILGALLALAVVLGLAWVVLRFLGQRMPGSGPAGSRQIQLIDRLQTGRNSSILLIRIQDKVLLVGQTDQRIEKLSEFEDPEKRMTPPETVLNSGFSTVLKDTASRMGFGKSNQPGKGGDA